MHSNRIAATKPNNLKAAKGFCLLAESNLTNFTGAIAGQLKGATDTEADEILRLTFAALRARQELRGALR